MTEREKDMSAREVDAALAAFLANIKRLEAASTFAARASLALDGHCQFFPLSR